METLNQPRQPSTPVRLIPPAAFVPIASTVAVFVAGLFTFGWIVHSAPTDIQLHASFIARCIEARFIPIDFVYYLAVAAVSWFSTDIGHILFASVLVLALALAGKYFATTVCLAAWTESDTSATDGASPAIPLSAAGLLLVFCLPLPGFHWYLGQFPPNQWHNSTTVMVMPFAVLLFHHSWLYLRTNGRRRLAAVMVFILLNLLTKLSLFLCFSVVFPIYVLIRFGFHRPFVRACFAVGSCGIVVVLYYLVVFFNPDYQTIVGDEGVGLTLDWLEPWRSYSPNVAISLLNSLLLPLLFLVGYPREFLADLRIRYASALFLVGVLLYAVVRETGDRALHGNLSWQNIISNYLLHLAIVAAYLRIRPNGRPARLYDWVLVTAFALMVASGAAYVVRIVTAGVYF